MNYYVMLGIAEDADEETIRSAFRALARRFHPDVGAGSSPVEFQRARSIWRSPIPNAAAGTTGNCETFVLDQSWFDR